MKPISRISFIEIIEIFNVWAKCTAQIYNAEGKISMMLIQAGDVQREFPPFFLLSRFRAAVPGRQGLRVRGSAIV
jgi:hypothetical protein